LNYNLIKRRHEATFVQESKLDESISFSDGMLFVEYWDLYHFAHKRDFKILKDDKNLDRTEFDCIIQTADIQDRTHWIVFEVKCYTDLIFE